ncbi:MAG: hypothetical protein NXI24_07755 [bacterium]|nr:hypothetical protein [bacterium]
MNRTQAKDILSALEAGGSLRREGAMNYTGDYVLDVLRYDASRDAFLWEKFDCHNDAGERFVRSEELTAAAALEYLESQDYAKIPGNLKPPSS